MSVTHVRVTNENDFPIHERFDARPYDFLPGKPVSVPIVAACHIFGWGATEDGEVDTPIGESGEMFPVLSHLTRRWGWNTVEPKRLANGERESLGEAADRTARTAAERVMRIKLQAVVQRLVEVPVEDDRLPPPREDAPQGGEDEGVTLKRGRARE